MFRKNIPLKCIKIYVQYTRKPVIIDTIILLNLQIQFLDDDKLIWESPIFALALFSVSKLF